jgi:hypothetical protein
MIKLYKNLDCNNFDQINQQIKSYVESLGIVESTTQFWNPLSTVEFLKSAPEFYNWLNSLNLRLHSLALTVGRDSQCCSIHTDAPPAANKLSWPIQNTAGTFNRWFRPRVMDPQVSVNPLGGKSFDSLNEFEEIARMEVLVPCIINASVPHDVWTDDSAKFPRLGLQCMLFNEPIL